MAERKSDIPHRPATRPQRWWKTGSLAADAPPRPGLGQSCPMCHMADLDFDSLFRLHCPNCDYVAECGAFT